jgi:hypothetical protein
MTNSPLSKMADRIVLSGSRDNTVTFNCEGQFVDLKQLKQQGVEFNFSKESGCLTLTVPDELRHLSPEQVCSDWQITVRMTPLRQAHVAAHTKFAHTKFAHTAKPQVVYPPCGPDEIIVIIAVSNESKVPDGATLFIDGKKCSIWIVAVNPCDVTRGHLLPSGHRQWFLNGVLPFTLYVDKVTGYNDSALKTRVDDITDMFERANKASCEAQASTYDEIAKQGRAKILQTLQEGMEAVERDSRPGANSDVPRVEPDASADVSHGMASPVPMFGEGQSSGNWADDAKNALLSTSASPPPSPAPREEEVQCQPPQPPQPPKFPQIRAKTTRATIVKNLSVLANKCGLQLDGTEIMRDDGITIYMIDIGHLLDAGILGLFVSARGNEIVAGQPTDDGTFRWGTCVNVVHKSYGALMALFPEMSAIVQQVIATRVALKVQKPHQNLQQGLLPFPEPMRVVPVFDTRGNVVAYQQMPPFA